MFAYWDPLLFHPQHFKLRPAPVSLILVAFFENHSFASSLDNFSIFTALMYIARKNDAFFLLPNYAALFLFFFSQTI